VNFLIRGGGAVNAVKFAALVPFLAGDDASLTVLIATFRKPGRMQPNCGGA
jgi:hypothetical protein